MASANLNGDQVSSASTETFITALVTGLIVAGAELAVFLLLKNKFRQIYNPRSYLVPPKKRTEALPHSFLGWIPHVIRADAKQLIAKNGLDAYVFVRYLFLMLEIFAPFMAVTWIILLPVDAANSRGSNTGITRFTFGNVGLSEQPRYAAHLILCWLLTFYVFYLIRREYSTFIVLRQDFLTSKEHASLAMSKTVLVTGVPKEYLNSTAMNKFCEVLPGGAKKIWFARDLKELPDLYDRREKACKKLESGETKLLKLANKAITKSEKKNKQAPALDGESDQGEIARWVPKKKRPSHKLGFLGLFGKKVDTIEWAREEITETTRLIEEQREILRGSQGDKEYAPHSAAFIQFHTQMAAHMFSQTLAHHAPLRMSARYLEVDQEDVIWDNLKINPYQARGRYVLSWAATLGLIILWSFPVAFVGLISNVNKLCLVAPWLEWLCTLPVPVEGIIQGSLPPAALAVLFILLPIVLRLFARFEGIPLRSGIELSLMTRYFLFLVIHGFLIVTLASGLVSAIPQIAKNPGSAVTLLATQLPSASTFFLTYFVTVSLAGAAGALLQIARLIIYYVKLVLLGSTPRAVYGVKYSMATVAWGTLFPSMTLLTVIGLTYSIIAPLICGFALVAFALYWFVYKYLFLLVIDNPPANETGGLFYPKALTHIFVGLYIEQICLCGLFFLAQDSNGNQSAIPQGAIMVVLIVITVLFQLLMLKSYKPLVANLPLSMHARLEERNASMSSPGSPANLRQTSTAGSNGNMREKDHSTFPPTRPSMEEEQALNGDKKRNAYQDAHSTASASASASGNEHLDKHAFDHPATYEDYPTIWIPRDNRGLYEREVADTKAAGVDVSTEGASMDNKGKVDISRGPPDEDWDESQQI